MKPVTFTFQLNKLAEFAQLLLSIMIADQCTQVDDFQEGGLVDKIGTYVWLNAIINPIARTLAWLFRDAAPQDHDAYHLKMTNARGGKTRQLERADTTKGWTSPILDQSD